MNALLMALDSIREKKGRSFLTMLGIIIGVTAVLVLVALVSGYNADITAYYEKLGVNKVNLSLTWYDRTRASDVYSLVYTYANDTLGDMVEGVSPSSSTQLPVKYRSTTLEESTIYLGSDQFSICNNYTLEDGRDLNEWDLEQRSKVCVLGSYVASALFPYTDPIGETVYLSGIPFTVVGTYYQKDGGTEDSMDDMLAVPYTLNRELLQSADVTSITVKVDTSQHVETVLAQLEVYLAQQISSSVGEYTLKSGLGGLIGIALGFGLSLILGKAMYDLILLPSLPVTLGAFSFSVAIGILFGIYPAVKASNLQPVDALRAD